MFGNGKRKKGGGRKVLGGVTSCVSGETERGDSRQLVVACSIIGCSPNTRGKQKKSTPEKVIKQRRERSVPSEKMSESPGNSHRRCCRGSHLPLKLKHKTYREKQGAGRKGEKADQSAVGKGRTEGKTTPTTHWLKDTTFNRKRGCTLDGQEYE